MKKQLDLFARQKEEIKKRNVALDLLEETRAELIDCARKVALKIVNKNGSVTSTEVLIEMHDLGMTSKLDTVDKRFMGAVFRNGWTRKGYENLGSHGRPVSVWMLK